MTIQEAVVILNERKHEDYDEWYFHEYAMGPEDHSLSEFEAIAVAEKYQREASQS